MVVTAKADYSFRFDLARNVWICSVHGEVQHTAWVLCWNGCEDGYFDAYEDDPINCDPGDQEICRECAGTGGWHVCPECNLNNPDAEF
jgi:hypothetical protein